MTEANQIAKSLRLQSEGRSQRDIAEITGRPWHGVRYRFLGQTATNGRLSATTFDAALQQLPLHLLHDSPHSRPVNKVHVAALAKSMDEVMAGLHRVEAARKLGWETIQAIIREADDLTAELVLIDENLCRQDLSPAERAMAVKRQKAIYLELHPETANGVAGKYRPQSQLRRLGEAEKDNEISRFTLETAEAIGISERTIQRDAARGEQLGEDILKKIVGTSLDKGEELDALAKLSAKKRDSLIERAATGEAVSAKPAVKQEKREERVAELGSKQVAAPDGKFGIITEDFEWDHVVWSRETGMDRHAGNHYLVSEDAHTAQEIVERTKDRFACAADDCLLAMWSTVQHLAIAIDVLRLRGFKYVSHHVWGKDRIGLGFWNRNKHESLLLGVKGHIPCPAPGTQWDSLIIAPVGKHSAKPDCFMAMIETYFPTLPKLELNARRARPGWATWGAEAPPMEIATSGPLPGTAATGGVI